MLLYKQILRIWTEHVTNEVLTRTAKKQLITIRKILKRLKILNEERNLEELNTHRAH